MNRNKIPLAQLYRRLFSRFWPERLKAYDMIAEELTKRGCRLFQFRDLMPYEIDATLLTGQIVSIYMKRFQPLHLAEFEVRLEELYQFLLQPMREERSPGHGAAEEMLLAIYDEDDRAARMQVTRFFQRKLRPERSVLDKPHGAGCWRAAGTHGSGTWSCLRAVMSRCNIKIPYSVYKIAAMGYNGSKENEGG